MNPNGEGQHAVTAQLHHTHTHTHTTHNKHTPVTSGILPLIPAQPTHPPCKCSLASHLHCLMLVQVLNGTSSVLLLCHKYKASKINDKSKYFQETKAIIQIFPLIKLCLSSFHTHRLSIPPLRELVGDEETAVTPRKKESGEKEDLRRRRIANKENRNARQESNRGGGGGVTERTKV